jgi:NAD(P)-dependent dehydrogenase (short-subunit alcohol dehydrogenase family)
VETKALQDKVIVVVGGTTGLGLSGARAIVAGGGWVVAIGMDAATSREADQAVGEGYVSLTADATVAGTAERGIELAVTRFGRFDGLYHVAGGSGRRMGDGPLHEVSDEGWEYTVRLNLTSMFLSNRAAVREFLRQKEEGRRQKEEGGVVLNMGSVLASSPSPKFFGTFGYAAAKSAVVGMTRSAAAYYAGENIRFNVVAPGLVDTPMARRAAGDEEIMAFVRTKLPVVGGGFGGGVDRDAAGVYLWSDGARFVTGLVWAVDGGWGVSEGQYPAE